MHNLINENLEYPESALENRIGGKVIVRFVVDTTGNATDIEVLQGVSADIDQEAVRLVGLLNNWTPGTVDGKKTRVRIQIPLTFSPDDKWKKQNRKRKKKKT
ncbi:MAG: energy transducer TonB [Saprospiraceae bacterium]|nr:energy transducer TonB [Lewinellaceae bacterium]